METRGNTEHCCRRGGRRENLNLPSSKLFTSVVAWRKKEEMVSREKVEPLSLETVFNKLTIINVKNK